MGTVMTVCMVLVSVFVIVSAIVPTTGRSGTGKVSKLFGMIALLAGSWNALWHGLRHLGEHWGHAALGSGLLMLLIGACLLVPARMPVAIVRALPLLALALAGFACYYGYTIYHL